MSDIPCESKGLRPHTLRPCPRAEKAEKEREELRVERDRLIDSGTCPTRDINGECTALNDQIGATDDAEATIERVKALVAPYDRKEWWSGHSGHAKAAVGKLLAELESALKEGE